jgi:hypothetical protein
MRAKRKQTFESQQNEGAQMSNELEIFGKHFTTTSPLSLIQLRLIEYDAPAGYSWGRPVVANAGIEGHS